MRNIRAVIFALAVGILLGGGWAQVQAAFTVSGPIEPTPVGIINALNTQLGNYFSLSGNAGELQFYNSASWATNSNVATTMTSLGPQGSHTTVQQWLVVVNNAGVVRFIPAY